MNNDLLAMSKQKALSYIEQDKPAGIEPDSVKLFENDIRVYSYQFKGRNKSKKLKDIHQAFTDSKYLGTEHDIKTLVGEAQLLEVYYR
jgi:hypothetical protein